MLEIEIAYGLADRQELHIMRVADGTRAMLADLAEAVSSVVRWIIRFAPLGIFGKVVKDDTVLRAHDRIEVYRPLLIDPKDARRKRVQDKEEGR